MDSTSCVASYSPPQYWDEITTFANNSRTIFKDIFYARPDFGHIATAF